MKHSSLLHSSASETALSACAPQAELVKTRSDLSGSARRCEDDQDAGCRSFRSTAAGIEKRIESLDTSIKGSTDVQKSIADYGARADQLATDIQLLQGRLEENNFRIADLSQKLDDKSFKIAELVRACGRTRGKAEGGGRRPGRGLGADRHGCAGEEEPGASCAGAVRGLSPGHERLQTAGTSTSPSPGSRTTLSQFPDASQADAAQYWVGECYYAKKDFKNAIDAFAKVAQEPSQER